MMCVYVIDSSSLINLYRQIPLDVFPSVWGKIESKIKDGKLIAPKEVRNELKRRNDALSQWIDMNPNMFVEDSDELRALAIEITRACQGTVNLKKQAGADIPVIALARLKKHQSEPIIVTQEKVKGEQLKIPYISKKYGIESIEILDMFRREKWRF